MKKYFDLLEIEKLKTQESTLDRLLISLNNLLSKKIRSNSIAYKEIKFLTDDMNNERLELNSKINYLLDFPKSNYSELKIETDIHEKLQSLKKEFKEDTLSQIINFLINFYEDELYTFKLKKISKFSISDTIDKNLRNTKFNSATSANCESIIIYTSEDLVIKNNIHYIDLDRFKKYKKDYTDSYLFSPLLTLADLDDFFNFLAY